MNNADADERPNSTFVELLAYRAQYKTNQTAYVFLADGEAETARLSYGELDRQARAIAAELHTICQPGERALLLYPSGLEFIAALFGCLYAGVMAVPAAVPRRHFFTRWQAIAADAEATVVLTTAAVEAKLRQQIEAQGQQHRWLVSDRAASSSWVYPAITGETRAILQYTSGSTGQPKGVIVTHRNLLHNQQTIQGAYEHSENTRIVGWLPLFHDMGLVGNVLQPLYLGIPCSLMPPTAFLQKPWRWLQAIARYRATTSGGPNFAYDLCVEKITSQQRAELDLSSWQVAFNGAEPVRAQTLKRFTETFKPCGFRPHAFYPCYGMAEATLLISGGLVTEKPVVCQVEQAALQNNQVEISDNDARELVGCGKSWLGQLVIACPKSLTPLRDEQIGEIWVASESVAQGYWQRPQETQQTFQAYLSTGEGPFLRTGDLGFLREGELFVTGRLKDLIIVRGRNYYPQDIELTVGQSHPALRAGCGAAFAVEINGEERLAVAQEVARTHRRRLKVEETIAAIREAVFQEHELDVYAVLLLETGSIPKTSSGKIQRRACRQQFFTNSFATVGASGLSDQGERSLPDSSTRPALEARLRDRCAQITGIAASKINPHRPLTSLGLNSLKAIEIKNVVEGEFNFSLPIESFWEDLSLTGLADRIQSESAAPIPPASSASAQQSFPPAASSNSNMEFSLFYFSSNEADTQNKYRLLIEGAKFADQNGLSAVWVPERHFHAFGGLYPNPAVLGAALAMVTQNIRLRAGSVVLPLHHPVLVAEEWSVVDHLSQGRIDLAFARGWNPNDFVLSPSAYNNATEVLYSGIDTIKKLWRGESFLLTNGEGKPAPVRLYPAPHQPELPIWLTCSGGKERFVEAGTLGVNVLSALLFQPLEELAEKIALYRQARRSHGHDPGHVTLMLHTFVGEDLAVVRRKVEKPFKNYLKSSVNLWRQGASSLADLNEQEQEHLLTYAFERYFQTALFGTPQSCLSLVNQLKEIGVNEIACLIDFGVEEDSVLSALYSLKKLKQLSNTAAARSSGRTLSKTAAPTSGERNQSSLSPFPFSRSPFRQELFPLSYGQQALWFLHQLNPESAAYNTAFSVRMGANLDVGAWRKALHALVARHPSLRTTFTERDGQPLQEVQETAAVPFETSDARGWTEDKLKQEAIAAYQRPFNLEQSPPLRAHLFLGSEQNIFLLVIHHIVRDGWSMLILIDELRQLYRSERTGQTATLPPLESSYQDYVKWQGERLASDERLGSYWQKQLAALPVLDLPTERGPRQQTNRGGTYTFKLTRGLIQRLQALAQAERATLFMTLLAAFQVLLHRYTGQDDIVVGSPTAGRKADFSRTVGYFVNLVGLRAKFTGKLAFKAFLAQVRQTVLEAIAHQDYPFSLLVERLQLQVSFVLVEAPPQFSEVTKLLGPNEAQVNWDELTLQPFVIPQEEGQFDLSLEVVAAHDTCILKYSSDFAEATIARMAGHWQTLLEGIVANPEQPVCQLPLLTEAEQQQLARWNATQVEYPQSQCIHERFEEQVERTPDAVAVEWGDQHLTYGELNARANHLAHTLQSMGVGSEVLVGICVERSPELVVGLLAILKAGGAYVPLDPAYPEDRLAFMLADAQVRVLLTQPELVAKLPQQQTILCLHDEDQTRTDNPNRVVKPENLAYVVYTSGTTGQPKGVLVPHSGLLNLVFWHQRTFAVTASDRATQLAGIAFDALGWELWPYLTAGATVCLVEPEVLLSPPQLQTWLVSQQITMSFLPTPLAERVLSLEWPDSVSLRLLLTGGDTLHSYPSVPFPVVNNYGPTENTVVTTSGAIAPHQTLSPPIGRPIANTQVYILDPQLQPVPVGIPGELYIGGAGLARGYLNRPELTAEKFIPNPFQEERKEEETGKSKHPFPLSPFPLTLYKTGDLARYLSDGHIEYLGRRDRQVKIRGFRIELGEIEAVLAACPRVQQAVVMACEAPGYPRLVAYVVPPQEKPTGAELRNILLQQLPEYMVPSAFVLLETLPLTPNGKIDYRALPASEPALTDASTTPRTPTQAVVAAIWTEVLGVEVGDHHNFFELGGHSLLVTQVVSRVREAFGLELPVPTLFTAPTLEAFSQQVECLRQEGVGHIPPLEPVPREQPLPLSFAQERLWFLEQLDGSAVYNVSGALRLRGSLNVERLQQALAAIVERHEVLRTCFPMDEGTPGQVISDIKLSVPLIDLQDSATAQSAQVQRLSQQEAQTPFDLEKGPLLRVKLLRLEPSEHILLVTLHHIVCDGWSVNILLRELSAFYQSSTMGASLPELPIQYADFAAWQRRWLRGDILDTQLDYWRKQLEGAPPLLKLPTDRVRPPVQSFSGRSETFVLDSKLITQLKALSQQSGTTLFMTLLAALGVLLSRSSRQEDLVIGTPIANRNQRELEPLIGFFTNTLALRLDASSNPSFTEFLQRVRQVTLAAYTHQDLPFEQLVETLQPERSLSHSPLFQVMFVFEDVAELVLPGLEGSLLATETTTAKFDLTLALRETEAGWQGRWEYSGDLFEAATIRRLSGHFQTLLTGIVANPEQSVSRLPLLTEPEHQLLAQWNATSVEYPPQCLHELFEAQVARTPDAVAVVFEETRLTYRELNERANQLAHHLQTLGVGPEGLVGICAERSPLMVIGLLAILKAGGAYLPLDPGYPTERLAFMLADAQVQVLLTQQNLVAKFPEAVQVVYLEQDRQEPPNNPVSRTTPDSLAYVIYTSGSTGQPKGVAIAHRSPVALVQWARTVFSAAEAGVLASTSLCFDLSVFELFVPLCWGGRVILALDALQLPHLSAADEVTLVNTVPSAIAELLRAKSMPQGVKNVNLAGEALHNDLVQQLYQQGIEKVYNLYGPTEDTTYSTFALIEQGTVGAPSIGRPIANTQVYILDPQLQPVPIGIPGELYIGGAGLARGYLNRPELTTEKFISPSLLATGNRTAIDNSETPNPFSLSPFPLTLYRTGDLARYRPDGNIEYLGRLDHQVKIRGFRIELGEIEAVLAECPQVQQAVVTAREDTPGYQRLVAYVVPIQKLTCRELRDYLLQKLPEYMVPSVFMLLDSLPLTPNGKIDRRALPAPEPIVSETEWVPPRTPTQAVLAAIWAEVLGVEVGIHHNFFELGGHSLLATQVMSRVRSAFGLELPLRSLFTSPTIEELSQQVDSRQAGLGLEPIKPVNRKENLPLSYAQQRLWFLEQLQGTAVYNMPAALRLSGALDKSALESALAKIRQRHEVLRTRFPMVEGLPRQVIESQSALTIPVIDLQNLPADQQTAQVQRLAEREAQTPFDLGQGPLLRVILLQLAPAEHILLLTMHHIICDGWSLGILLREVSVFYQACTTGEAACLPELPIQYADFAVWQRQWLRGISDTQLNYWQQQLQDAPPLLELPTDRPRPPVQSFSGGSESFLLPPELTAQLKALSQQCGTTLFMTLLAALGILLSRYSRQEDIVIGAPIANRNRQELEPLIGFFANTLALRLDLQGNPSLREFLQRVRQVTLEAYAHQDLPFERLVEAQSGRDLSHSPIFQVMFALQNAPWEDLKLPGLSWTPLETRRHHTQFDLTLSLRESASGLEGVWEYNAALFEAATMSRAIASYQTLLAEIVANPEQPIGHFSLLTPAQQQLLVEWNATAADYPAQSMAQLFEKQVQKTPHAIAVEGPLQQLSYRELNTRANQLAHYLHRLGVGPEVLVGICTERSVEMIVALLGIL
ncbi:MAG: amino acid adenylation domain-containing protein, partial [Cyanophyceae cyanobacterium]